MQNPVRNSFFRSEKAKCHAEEGFSAWEKQNPNTEITFPSRICEIPIGNSLFPMGKSKMSRGGRLLRLGKAKSQHGNHFSLTEMRNSDREFAFSDGKKRNVTRRKASPLGKSKIPTWKSLFPHGNADSRSGNGISAEEKLNSAREVLFSAVGFGSTTPAFAKRISILPFFAATSL